MIGAGFRVQRHRPKRSPDKAVADVGIAFVVALVIFVIAIDCFKHVAIDRAVSAEDFGFADLERAVKATFPIAFKVADGRALFLIGPLGGAGPESLGGCGVDPAAPIGPYSQPGIGGKGICRP